MAPLLLIFLDGVGIGPPDQDVNPFFRAKLPTLSQRLGGSLPSLDRLRIEGSVAHGFPIDACMGVDGTPGSGTGQVALLTGRNAPRILGRHFGPWPPVRLRSILDDDNLLRRAVRLGKRVTFANAYPRGYPAGIPSRYVAAPPLAALSAGLLNRDDRALASGDAVASDIVNDRWHHIAGIERVPTVTPEDAGANLARLAHSADLTFFAHYQTDFAGHRGGMNGATRALECVDRFLAGILANLLSDHAVLVVSDHGNLEDIRFGHTRNPALGLAFGVDPSTFGSIRRISDIPDAVIGYLSGRLVVSDSTLPEPTD